MTVGDLFGEYVEVTFHNGDTLRGLASRAQSDYHAMVGSVLVRVDAVRSWRRSSPDEPAW